VYPQRIFIRAKVHQSCKAASVSKGFSKANSYVILLGKCATCDKRTLSRIAKQFLTIVLLISTFRPALSRRSPLPRLSAGGLLPPWNGLVARSCRFFHTPHSSARILSCSLKIPWSSPLFPSCCRPPAELRSDSSVPALSAPQSRLQSGFPLLGQSEFARR